MSKPATRLSDTTSHGNPAVPGPGSSNVFIGKKPAWRTMLDTHLCPLPMPTPHGPEKCFLGSTTVFINKQMACRIGDILQGAGPPNPFVAGEMTVYIGDVGYGMAKQASMMKFVYAMQEIGDNWDKLSVDNRKKALLETLNNALPEEVPDIELNFKDDLDENVFGEQSPSTWSIDINNNLFTNNMTDNKMAKLTSTIYHEGRHAEQDFNAAQWMASQGLSVEKIQDSMDIPVSVAEAAVNNPAKEGSPELITGEAFYQSVYGDRSDYRDKVYNNLVEIDLDIDAYDTEEKYNDAVKLYEMSYKQYKSLPEEADAYHTENQIKQLNEMKNR